MTSNKHTAQRTALIVFFIMLLAVISLGAFSDVNMHVNGHETGIIGGFFGFVLACGIGTLALLFALGLTGVVLAGVGILLFFILVVVLGSLALALLPLLFPVLLIVGLVALFSKRNPA